MAHVVIPALLRDLTAGRTRVTVPGATVGEVLDNLERQYPGFKARLFKGERLVSSLAIFVDDERASLGLLEPVSEEDEIRFLVYIAGG